MLVAAQEVIITSIMADIMKEIIYAKYLENFPKGITLIIGNFLLGGEGNYHLDRY